MSDRFHIPPADWDESAFALTGDEAKHCAQVMRHREGDEIIVFNGVGDVARARITAIKKHEIGLECISIEHIEPPATRITLAPALIKADRWEWLLEKATELGATEIQPLITERCVVKLGAEDSARKHDKWQRIIIEACKQCRRAWVPELRPVRRFAEVCAEASRYNLAIIGAMSDRATPLLQAVTEARARQDTALASVLILIGPEGDFTADESRLSMTSGIRAVTLGPLTLRAETASICALSLIGRA